MWLSFHLMFILMALAATLKHKNDIYNEQYQVMRSLDDEFINDAQYYQWNPAESGTSRTTEKLAVPEPRKIPVRSKPEARPKKKSTKPKRKRKKRASASASAIFSGSTRSKKRLAHKATVWDLNRDHPDIFSPSCKWPYQGVLYAAAMPCEFNEGMFTDTGRIDTRLLGKIYRIREGSILYHAQTHEGKETKTKEKSYGAWFVASEKHIHFHAAGSGRRVQRYVVTKKMDLVFIPSLVQKCYELHMRPIQNGGQFVAQVTFPPIVTGLDPPGLAGYVGCNECEIYFTWENIDENLEIIGEESSAAAKFMDEDNLMYDDNLEEIELEDILIHEDKLNTYLISQLYQAHNTIKQQEKIIRRQNRLVGDEYNQ